MPFATKIASDERKENDNGRARHGGRETDENDKSKHKKRGQGETENTRDFAENFANEINDDRKVGTRGNDDVGETDDFEFLFEVFIKSGFFADKITESKARVWWTDVFFDEITEFLFEDKYGIWWVWLDDF